MNRIPREEFAERVENLRTWMRTENIDTCFVYGDEYRRENLRYMTNNWPIFERSAVVIPLVGEPVILGAPEGKELCREMSAWDDIRLVPEFTCVTVPDEIVYPFADYTTFKAVFADVNKGKGMKRLGVVGIDAMPHYLYEKIVKSSGAEIIDANNVLNDMRLRKSDNEVKCLLKAVEIADRAYTELMKAAIPGVTELELSAIAIGEAMKLGAEYVPFCLVMSGNRVSTIVGRATQKVIEDGDMVSAALAVQYEGYIASFAFPFVAGNMTGEQRQFITWLVEAYETAIANIGAGIPQNTFVIAVKDYFHKHGLSEYDLYPPLHGCGMSEAENPYPNEVITTPFLKNMTVNTDISLFGHFYGSNRIETSFVVTENGCYTPSILFKTLIDAWKNGDNYQKVL